MPVTADTEAESDGAGLGGRLEGSSSACVMIVQSDAGYATQVSTNAVHLRVVEERRVALVDLARGDLARARTSRRPRGKVREVHALLLGLVEDGPSSAHSMVVSAPSSTSVTAWSSLSDGRAW